MQTKPMPPRRGRKQYMVAMVLGTALSALGSSVATAMPAHAERAVADISRYCTTCWRNARLHPDYWTDCTQEVFHRLLERVNPDAWGRVLKVEGDERREFLRAIDAVKKRGQRSRQCFHSPMDLISDRNDFRSRCLAEERDAVEQVAKDVLSPRQQRIIRMSFEGWSVQEIGQELSLPADRVSDEKYKAIRKLRVYLNV